MPERTPDPGDADQAEVRRLLRDARADGPPPPDVVARLDETLASLVAERHGSDAGHAPTQPPPGDRSSVTTAATDELAARRRRRRGRFAGVGIAAAATLIGAGFLTTVVISDDEPDSAGERSSQVTANHAEEPGAEDNAPDADSAAPTEAPSRAEPPAQAMPDRLPDDQRFAVEFTLDSLGVSSEGYVAPLDQSSLSLANASCSAAVDSADSAVLIVVDGATRVLALDPRDADGGREVRVLDCNVDPPTLQTTVDVPAP